MKKFTSLLLLLLLTFVGGVNFAYADDFTVKKLTTFGGTSDAVQDLSGLTDGSTYVLRCNGERNKYVQVNPTTKRMDFVSNLATDDAASALSVFTLHTSTVDGETVYSFELGNTGLYVPHASKNADVAVSSTESPATFKVEKASDGLFYIYYVRDATAGKPNLYFNGKPSTFTMWDESGGNSQYSFIPVSVGDDVTYRNVTVNVKDGDATVASFTNYYMTDGQVVSLNLINNNLPFTRYLHLTTTSTDVVSADNTTFNYSSELTNAPVEFGEWYTLRTRDDEAHYVLGTPSGASYVIEGYASFSSSVQSTYPLFSGALWKFEKSGVGVKLYNKRVGQYLKSNGGSAATFDATGTVFYFYPADNSRFVLWAGSGNNCLGNHAGWNQTQEQNLRMGVYGSFTDHGSWFTAVKADASDDVLAVGKAALEASVTPSDQSLASIEVKAKAAIDALPVQSIANFDNVLATCVYPTLDPNAYYRIKNVNVATSANTFISAENIYVGTDGVLRTAFDADNNMDRTIKRTSESGSYIAQMWQFVPNSDGTSYKVRNANTQCMMSEYTDVINNANSGVNSAETKGLDMPVDPTTGGDFVLKALPNIDKLGSVTNDPVTMFQMLANNHRMNAFGGGDFKLIRDYGGNHDQDPGNYWQIIKVTSIPVAIGETGWTSVCYPFEVTIPSTSTVKAYYAGNPSNGYVALTEVTNGVIPANTGVFLVNESGAANVNLDITSTGATVPAGVTNSLQGATAQRVGFGTEGATYLLGLNSSNEPALLKSKLNWVPANKAYLLATALTNGVSVLSFGFGQNAGISDAVSGAEADTETYYDLNGRVVLYPQHGIFVTKSGRKVYIK